MASEIQPTEVSISEFPEEINPFVHRIVMSPARWFRTYLLAIILIPIRLFLIFLSVILTWLTAKISLFGVSDDQLIKEPLKGWRNTVGRRIMKFFGKFFIW